MTQKDQVVAALEQCGGHATFSELYRIVDTSSWKTNTPQASIRRIVQLLLTYERPKLEIVSFDAATGAVRFKVTPGVGNEIVSEIATGYVHVYGTDTLGEKMRFISSVGFDLTPYLKPETRGEGVLNVTLGSHTFLKIKVEDRDKAAGECED